MAATSRPDLVLDALVTRLGDISTSNTYYGGGSYLTNPANVERGLLFGGQPDPGSLPEIRVGYIGEIQMIPYPGGRLRCEATVLVQIWPKRADRTPAQIKNDNYDLRGDVILAVAEDPQLGGNVVQMTPRAGDGSADRPEADGSMPPWAGVEFKTFWYQCRSTR